MNDQLQLWGRFVNHYWDSLEGNKEIVLDHIKSVLDYHYADSAPAQRVPIEAEYVKKVAKALRAGIGLGGPAAADLIETLYLAALPALASTECGEGK